MNDPNAYPVERLITQIARYLRVNPYAADTIAGIQKWWLSGVVHGEDIRAIENAIQVMLYRGMLECRTLPDGTRVYSRPLPTVPSSQDLS